MSQWHCRVGDAEYGPITEEKLLVWISERRVRHDTPVWKEGMAEWKDAGTIDSFSEAFRTVPPPIQSQPKIAPLNVPAKHIQSDNFSEEEKVLASKKICAGILAILLGGWGVHKFYLGYPTAGVVMLLIWFSGWILIIPFFVIWIIAIIEGVRYLTISEEEFVKEHIDHNKSWF